MYVVYMCMNSRYKSRKKSYITLSATKKAQVVSKNKHEVCEALLTKGPEQRIQGLINTRVKSMGPFFYFNRSRFMKGVWGISRGSFNLYLD